MTVLNPAVVEAPVGIWHVGEGSKRNVASNRITGGHNGKRWLIDMSVAVVADCTGYYYQGRTSDYPAFWG
jgi:hypothetical protein